MKKVISLILASLLVTAGLLTGCKKNEEQQENSGNLKADIVVVGGGGAGMSAALQANQNGCKNVVVLEKMPQTGGNTLYSTGGMNAAATKVQESKGIEDSVELMIDDTMKGGKNLNDPELVKTLAENSAAAVDWIQQIGGDLSDVGRAGGASVDRIHRPAGGSAVGPMIVKTLNENLEKASIPVLLDTKVTEIMLDDDGIVKGVKATRDGEDVEIECKAVVLAAGGFGANSEMVVSYKPELDGFNTTNQQGATGDGIVLAQEIGADVVDMDQIQIHPTVEPFTATLLTEGMRGEGAILVNKDGNRFIDELETRDVVSAAILEQPDKIAYLMFDQNVRDNLAAIEKYINKGIITEADTVEGLATELEIDPAALTATIDEYNGYKRAGNDEAFGRDDMNFELNTPKFYAGVCAPAVHHTMGGVKINPSAEVLNTNGEKIGGLFAAGEVTGGVHGANRLGGTAVTDIIVFGRIAGDSSNEYVLANGGYTDPTIEIEKDESQAATPEKEGNFQDGVYTGEADGNNGPVKVEVTVEEGNIVSVVLTEHSETEGIYESAEKQVTADIIKTQSTEVDTVAGATNTSNAIKGAVTNALKDAQK